MRPAHPYIYVLTHRSIYYTVALEPDQLQPNPVPSWSLIIDRTMRSIDHLDSQTVRWVARDMGRWSCGKDQGTSKGGRKLGSVSLRP